VQKTIRQEIKRVEYTKSRECVFIKGVKKQRERSKTRMVIKVIRKAKGSWKKVSITKREVK
jgi:hypothetical protein